MLFSPVFAEPNPHFQRSSRPRCASRLSSFTSRASLTSFKSFPLYLFADPHPLTPIPSVLYRSSGGQGRF